MDNNKPAGGDLPRQFYDEQPFKVEASDQLLKMNQDLAEHDVEVARHKLEGMLQQLADYIFETSMENAKKSPKQARKADDFIRKLFDGFPEAIAQWDAFIQTCEIADEEIEDL
jgi:ElaB/YqjD/DUF883 family membrane-anchored ribosome-binding protein